MVQSRYDSKYREFTNPGEGLPVVSTQLDSVRAYQFEVHFAGLPSEISDAEFLTLAAKQVQPGSVSVETIEVNRLNEKLYYPGKASREDLVITFDHLYTNKISPNLWNWFKSVYNPVTGDATPNNSFTGPVGSPKFKANKLEVIYLDNLRTPFATLSYYGVYPSSFKMSELNYATSDFATIEVTFKYDFVDFNRTSNSQ